MRDQVIRVGKRFFTEFQKDDLTGLSAELAYRFLFAVFPFGIFVAALTAFVARWLGIDNPTGQLIGALGDNLPPQVAEQIRPQLEAVIGTTQPGLLSFGAIGALWAATGGTMALIKAMNRAYEVEEARGVIARYATAIGLTLLATGGILVAFVTIVGASVVTEEVARQLGLSPGAFELLSLIRWPIVFLLLTLAVGLLYRLAPNLRAPWLACLAGGAIFAIGWLVATAVFAFYVANFSNYGNTYGALGGVIILMLWFYLSALVLVAAAELIAVALKELDPATVEEGRRKARDEAAARDAEAEGADRGPVERVAGSARGAMAQAAGAVTGDDASGDDNDAGRGAGGGRFRRRRSEGFEPSRSIPEHEPPTRERQALRGLADNRIFAGAVTLGGLVAGMVAAWAAGRAADEAAEK